MKYEPNKWFSLRFVIYHLWKLRKTYGKVVVLSNKYQKEREAWIVAVALLGITKMTRRLWWVQIPEEDPPDILAMTVISNEKKGWNDINYRKVEVMEITKYSKHDIVHEIINKVKDKYYEKETCLVVYLRLDTNIKDMRKISTKLKGKFNNLADIWIIGNTKPDTNDFIVFSIFPEVHVITYNIDEEINKLPPGDTLVLSRTKGIKMKLIRGVFPVKFNPKVDVWHNRN